VLILLFVRYLQMQLHSFLVLASNPSGILLFQDSFWLLSNKIQPLLMTIYMSFPFIQDIFPILDKHLSTMIALFHRIVKHNWSYFQQFQWILYLAFWIICLHPLKQCSPLLIIVSLQISTLSLPSLMLTHICLSLLRIHLYLAPIPSNHSKPCLYLLLEISLSSYKCF
jgi:hypothetical protein